MKFAEFIGYKLMNIIVNNILLLINFWHVLPRDMVKVNIYLSKSPPEQGLSMHLLLPLLISLKP